MSDIGRALLAEVCERVDDDAPKLVYADWLEEYGGEPDRARAIRLGVERRKLDDLDPRAWAIDSELERLDDYPPEAWEAALPPLDCLEWGWSGGLVVLANDLSPEDLLRWQDLIFSTGPITRLVVGVVEPGDAEMLLGCRYLHRVRSLALAGITSPEALGLARLAECPALAGLRELELSQCDHQASLLVSMAGCRPFPALRSLDLSRNYFVAGGLRALADAPLLGTLHTLDLSGAVAAARGMRELLRSPHLAGLRKLAVRECGVDTGVVREMAAYPWRALEWLDLSMNNLGPVSGRLLGESPGLGRLRYLDLSGNPDFGDGGARGLAQSSDFSELRALDVGHCRLTRAGVEALAGAPWLANLTALSLADRLGVAGIKVLAEAPLHNLRKLDLSYCELGDAEVRALLACPWLAGLTHLTLDSNKITRAGALALARADNLDGIVSLDLCHNKPGRAASARLRERFGDRVVLKWPWED